MATLQSDLANFVQNFVLTRLATSFAAFFVVRAILDTVQGGHPLPSVLGAMFLLAIQTTLNLINSYNSGTSVRDRGCARQPLELSRGDPLPDRRRAGRHRSDLEFRVTEARDADDRRHDRATDSLGASGS